MTLRTTLTPGRGLLVVLAAATALLAGKFGNGFVIDDIAMIVEGDAIQHLGSIPGFWFSQALAASGVEAGAISSFRPIALTLFALEYAVWGDAPFGYHLTNLALHLVASALVWLVAGILLGRERSAARLCATAAFAVHPAIGEAHVWINGRSDVLALIFGLAGLVTLEQALRTAGPRWVAWGAATATALLLACLSKETALFFGPVYSIHVLWRWNEARRDRRDQTTMARRGALVLIAGAIAGLAFLALRARALEGIAAGSSRDALVGLHNLGLLLLDGLAQLALPTRPEMRVLAGEYAELPPAVFALAWAAVLLLLLWAGWVGRRQAGLWHAAVAWPVALAPISIISAVQWPGFGRYLYMPAAFVFIAAAGGMDRLLSARSAAPGVRPRRGVSIALVAWFVWLVVVLQWQIGIYRDVESFLTPIHSRNPAAKLVYSPLGQIRAEQGRLDEAIPMLRHAVELNPADEEPWVNLATALLAAGALADAHATSARGLERFDHRGELYNVAAASIADRDAAAAVSLLLRCQEQAPTYGRCASNLTMLTTTHPRAAEFRAALEALARP